MMASGTPGSLPMQSHPPNTILQDVSDNRLVHDHAFSESIAFRDTDEFV